MKKLIENTDGLFTAFSSSDLGDILSAPFEKDSESYNEKLAEGFDLVLLSQSEKDAHALSEAIAQANNQVQAMLDTEAQSRDYDNINSIGKYVGYPNDNQVECEALGAWAASCWTKCKALKAGGVMPDDLLAEMPELAV